MKNENINYSKLDKLKKYIQAKSKMIFLKSLKLN